MQTLFTGPGKTMQVKIGFTGANKLDVFETREGDYCHSDGTLVKERKNLEWLPEPHKTKALEWFDGFKKIKKEEPELEVIAEPKRPGRPRINKEMEK